MDDGIGLRDYAATLMSKWWVVLLTLAVTLAAAVVASFQLPPNYQVRTQLLLVSRTSERLTGSGGSLPNVASALSVDTLSNLALANDLLESIGKKLDVEKPGGSGPMAVETLADMMKVSVKVSEQGNNRTALPLLTLTVRGEDPALLKRVAETWADLFIQKNASLFASESARSYDFIQAQYEETRRALALKNQEKLRYLEQKLVQPLRSEFRTLAGEASQTRTSLEFNASESGLLVVGSTSRTGLFGKFLSDLEEKRVALAAAAAEEKKLTEQLKDEPQKVVRTATASAEKSATEEINQVYVFLREKQATASARAVALTAEIKQLELKTGEFRKAIQDLSEQIVEIEAGEFTYDTEISVLTSNLQALAARLQEARLAKEEQGGTIRVVESPILPRVSVGPNRQQLLLPAVAIGLLVGIILALVLQYVQKGTLKARPVPPS